MSADGDPLSLLAALPSLPRFLRALLVADGTVTLLLEAYFCEAIKVETLFQAHFEISAGLPALQLEPGDAAFYREVLLCGSQTGRIYARAFSVLNPQALRADLFESLIKKDVGMGEVLRNSARGSYREVLDIQVPGEELFERTYAVVLDKQPAILITERFDARSFAAEPNL